MGGHLSVKKSNSSFDRQDSDQSESYSDFLIDDLLINILSFVPAEDLIKNCRLVCKQWKDTVDGHSIWKTKCEWERFKIPACTLDRLPNHFYRYIYFHGKSKKNLIKNPYGEKHLSDWIVHESGGDGFAVENPPSGADPVPNEVGSQSCFATSYYICKKYQEIDLYENKINKLLLTNSFANIRVGEWYASRFDCACQYELSVLLLDDKKKEIDKFEFKFTEQQWLGKEWHLASHEFVDVANARFVYFEHAGNDCQFWAGHYGSKFTGAFVDICIKEK